MKTTILLAVFILLAPVIFSQTGNSFVIPHDSLLFDGSDATVTVPPCDSSDCLIKITRREHARIFGWRCRKEKGLLCGVKEVEGTVMKREELYEGDYIRPGDSIMVTGKDAEFSLSWFDNGVLLNELYTTKFRTAQSWVVPKDFCEVNKDWDFENGHFRDFRKFPLINGSWWWKTIKSAATGGQSFEVETEQCGIGTRGTEFTVDVSDNGDVIKVYEGSVIVKPKKFKFSANEEFAKLTADYQNGKLTLEEYTKKAKELAPAIKDEATDVSKKIIVDTGNQVTINSDGSISDIAPIGADDDKWWEK